MFLMSMCISRVLRLLYSLLRNGHSTLFRFIRILCSLCVLAICLAMFASVFLVFRSCLLYLAIDFVDFSEFCTSAFLGLFVVSVLVFPRVLALVVVCFPFLLFVMFVSSCFVHCLSVGFVLFVHCYLLLGLLGQLVAHYPGVYLSCFCYIFIFWEF